VLKAGETASFSRGIPKHEVRRVRHGFGNTRSPYRWRVDSSGEMEPTRHRQAALLEIEQPQTESGPAVSRASSIANETRGAAQAAEERPPQSGEHRLSRAEPPRARASPRDRVATGAPPPARALRARSSSRIASACARAASQGLLVHSGPLGIPGSTPPAGQPPRRRRESCRHRSSFRQVVELAAGATAAGPCSSSSDVARRTAASGDGKLLVLPGAPPCRASRTTRAARRRLQVRVQLILPLVRWLSECVTRRRGDATEPMRRRASVNHSPRCPAGGVGAVARNQEGAPAWLCPAPSPGQQQRQGTREKRPAASRDPTYSPPGVGQHDPNSRVSAA